MRVTAQRWDCQLINVDVLENGVILDLIAPRWVSVRGLPMPVGWPFVVRIVDQQASGCADLVATWARRGEVISLRFVYDRAGAKWLDVAAADRHLILELR